MLDSKWHHHDVSTATKRTRGKGEAFLSSLCSRHPDAEGAGPRTPIADTLGIKNLQRVDACIQHLPNLYVPMYSHSICESLLLRCTCCVQAHQHTPPRAFLCLCTHTGEGNLQLKSNQAEKDRKRKKKARRRKIAPLVEKGKASRR